MLPVAKECNGCLKSRLSLKMVDWELKLVFYMGLSAVLELDLPIRLNECAYVRELEQYK